MKLKVISIVLLLVLGCFLNISSASLAPPVLTCQASGLNLSLTWDDIPVASGYTLYYAPYPYTGPDSIGSIDLGTSTSYSIDLWEGATFYVAVEAYGLDWNSGYSNIELFVTTEEEPIDNSLISEELVVSHESEGVFFLSDPANPFVGGEVKIEAGTVNDTVTLSFKNVPETSGDNWVLGSALSIEPYGVTFNNPITVTLPYSNSDLIDANLVTKQNLYLEFYDQVSGQWDSFYPVSNEINANLITFETDRSGQFRIKGHNSYLFKTSIVPVLYSDETSYLVEFHPKNAESEHDFGWENNDSKPEINSENLDEILFTFDFDTNGGGDPKVYVLLNKYADTNPRGALDEIISCQEKLANDPGDYEINKGLTEAACTDKLEITGWWGEWGPKDYKVYWSDGKPSLKQNSDYLLSDDKGVVRIKIIPNSEDFVLNSVTARLMPKDGTAFEIGAGSEPVFDLWADKISDAQAEVGFQIWGNEDHTYNTEIVCAKNCNFLSGEDKVADHDCRIYAGVNFDGLDPVSFSFNAEDYEAVRDFEGPIGFKAFGENQLGKTFEEEVCPNVTFDTTEDKDSPRIILTQPTVDGTGRYNYPHGVCTATVSGVLRDRSLGSLLTIKNGVNNQNYYIEVLEGSEEDSFQQTIQLREGTDNHLFFSLSDSAGNPQNKACKKNGDDSFTCFESVVLRCEDGIVSSGPIISPSKDLYETDENSQSIKYDVLKNGSSNYIRSTGIRAVNGIDTSDANWDHWKSLKFSDKNLRVFYTIDENDQSGDVVYSNASDQAGYPLPCSPDYVRLGSCGYEFNKLERVSYSINSLSSGINEVEIWARDIHGNESTRPITIVYDTNRAPSLRDFSYTPKELYPHDITSVSINGSDPDGDWISVWLSNNSGPGNTYITDKSQSGGSYSMKFSAAEPGDYTLTFNVSDGQKMTTSTKLITVSDPGELDLDGDGYIGNEDCNDNSALINPGTVWYLDADGDSYSDGTQSVGCERPGNGYVLSQNLVSTEILDCDDADASIAECALRLDAPVISYTLSGINLLVTWDAVPGATGYKLNYALEATTDKGRFTSVDVGINTSFSYGKLLENQTYSIAVQAYNDQESSDYSNIESFAVKPAPVANAGKDLIVLTGSPLIYPIDPKYTFYSEFNGGTDTIIFTWSMDRPNGSNAELSDKHAIRPKFTPDVDGDYILQLVVNDGTLDSAPDSVTITAITPNAGLDQEVTIGETVTLGSSENVAGLTYTWLVDEQPPEVEGEIQLSNTSSPQATFIPDVIGSYTFTVEVRDVFNHIFEDSVSINVSGDGTITDLSDHTTSYQMIRHQTSEAGDNSYIGWIQVSLNGQPANVGSFLSLSVTDSMGSDIELASTGIDFENYVASVCQNGPCNWYTESETGVYFKANTLSLGDYTVEIEMNDGRLNTVIPFNEDISLPVISSSSMAAEWQDENLLLEWTNPTSAANWNNVNWLVIVIKDNSGEVVGWLKFDPTKESFLVPASEIEKMKNIGNGTLASWNVQTRHYTNDARNTQTARGFSSEVELPLSALQTTIWPL